MDNRRKDSEKEPFWISLGALSPIVKQKKVRQGTQLLFTLAETPGPQADCHLALEALSSAEQSLETELPWMVFPKRHINLKNTTGAQTTK